MLQEYIPKRAKELREELVNWRRHFHENPEVELDCFNTSAIVAEELKKINFNVRTGYAKTGIVASFGNSSPVVAVRVDMDALRIEERTKLPFASKKKGIMHGCGHDGHTAIGLGVAHVMSSVLSKLPGKIILIFQPGEEYPGGAPIMIKDGALEDKPDMIFGMHIFPDLPFGKIGLRYGVMTASNVEYSIDIIGKEGHGAYPHRTIDPFPAAASMINSIYTIVSRNIPPLDSQVISLSEIKGGAGYNIVPSSISIKGTIRSLDETNKETALKRIKEIASGIETSFRVSTDLKITEREPVMICDEAITALAENALVEYFGKDSVVRLTQPSMGVDDFSFYTKLIPATYLRLGCYDHEKGYTSPLHTSSFDFDEDLLVKAVEAISIIIYKALQRKT